MNKNVGTVDKVLRIILGAGLVSIVFIGPQTPWGWIGVTLIVTAFVSFCPLYPLLKISTIKKA
jgi:hypothetical protein